MRLRAPTSSNANSLMWTTTLLLLIVLIVDQVTAVENELNSRAITNYHAKSLIRTRRFLYPYGIRTSEYTEALTRLLHERQITTDLNAMDPQTADKLKHEAIASFVMQKYKESNPDGFLKVITPQKLPFTLPERNKLNLPFYYYKWLLISNGTLLKFKPHANSAGVHCTAYMLVCNDKVAEGSENDFSYDPQTKRLTIKKENLDPDVLFYAFTRNNHTKIQHFFRVMHAPTKLTPGDPMDANETPAWSSTIEEKEGDSKRTGKSNHAISNTRLPTLVLVLTSISAAITIHFL